MKKSLIVFFLVLLGVGISWYAWTAFQDAARTRALNTAYASIATACLKQNTDPAAHIADVLRDCVHDNTVFAMDREFYATWKHPDVMAQAVLDYMHGARSTKPHFECSTRSGLLIGLLRSQGLTARDVIVVKDELTFPDHVMVEVWDPVSGEWEAQGPTYNNYYIEKKTGERLSVEEMLTLSLDDVVPCFGPGTCGWGLISDEKLKLSNMPAYLGAMVVKNDAGDWQLKINPRRFDPHQEIQGQSYCEKREKHCHEPVLTITELN